MPGSARGSRTGVSPSHADRGEEEGTYVAAGAADDFLELLALALAVLVELLKVLDALLGLGERLLLEVGGLAQELLGRDLRSPGRVSAVLRRVQVGARTCTAAGALFLTRPAPPRSMADEVEGGEGR